MGAESDRPEEHPASDPLENVTVIRRRKPGSDEEREFHIVGTAHVSKKSVDEVERVIEQLRPDTVCVELCPTRHAALTDDSRWRKLDAAKIVRQGDAGFVLATLALQAFQRRIGDKLGVRPGAELLAAAQVGERVGARVVLADRDVQVTLRRAWVNLGWFKRLGAQLVLLMSAFGGEDIDEQQVEQLKKREHISDLMSELAKVAPEVKVPLIDERDRYLMSQIEEAPGRTVVAVVGAGHVQGMLTHLGASVDRTALEVIPPPSLAARMQRALLPVAALALIAIGLLRHRPWPSLVAAWAIPTAACAALFAILTGAKPLTLLASTALAPLLALDATSSTSRVVGRVEACLRRPGPDDGERLGREVTTIKAAFGNAITRTLIVAVAANMGIALGALIGTVWLAVRVW